MKSERRTLTRLMKISLSITIILVIVISALIAVAIGISMSGEFNNFILVYGITLIAIILFIPTAVRWNNELVTGREEDPLAKYLFVIDAVTRSAERDAEKAKSAYLRSDRTDLVVAYTFNRSIVMAHNSYIIALEALKKLPIDYADKMERIKELFEDKIEAWENEYDCPQNVEAKYLLKKHRNEEELIHAAWQRKYEKSVSRQLRYKLEKTSNNFSKILAKSNYQKYSTEDRRILMEKRDTVIADRSNPKSLHNIKMKKCLKSLRTPKRILGELILYSAITGLVLFLLGRLGFHDTFSFSLIYFFAAGVIVTNIVFNRSIIYLMIYKSLKSFGIQDSK